MAIAAGTRLDRYEILSPLGAGGMGEVYLALDTRLDRRVALKLLPAQFTQDADRVRRFVQEAKAASALNHPNIITIYEIGEIGGTHFMATEFIEGQTLRQQMTRARMELSAALDVVVQVASALTAAHAAGIVHRDIKPENIMVRPDGLVKVLDFGLVKLTERKEVVADTNAPTSAGTDTDPGTVMGTAQYMSPEQARGQKVDARTDIFSLAVVLYEMIAGTGPFAGATVAEVFAAILKTEPKPLAHCLPEAPSELEHIVGKALRKDREERYQTVKDVLIDLKDLKRRLEFEAQLQRSVQPGARGQATTKSSNQPALETARADAASTGEGAAVPTISSAKILLGEIKRHKLGVALTLAAIVIAVVAAFFYFNRKPVLTDKDTILLADFVNTTGDVVFDGGTLKQGLAVQLEQSPFLNIFPEERVREALRFMGRSPDERVTREVAREICQRQGLKAMLLGSIAKFDRNYAITLEAVNGQTGEAITRQQVEAEGKDQVIKAVGSAATKLREKLGESLASLQKFDAPIEQATTSSLEALKAFSQGNEQRDQGKSLEAVPLYQRAVELDPNFALAWAKLAGVYSTFRQNELATRAAEKAFELRERVSERERFFISESYYANVAREPEKRVELLELWKRAYPREVTPRISLAAFYNGFGQFEKAVEEAREAIRLNPNFAPAYSTLALAFIRLNRFDEARETYERALQQKLDSPGVHYGLYQVALIQGDEAAMKRQIDWAAGKQYEYHMLGLQAEAAAFSGRLRQAHELSSRAVELATRRNLREIAGGYAALNAEWSAYLGHCQQAREDIARASAYPRTPPFLFRIGIAHALCGEVRQADEMIRQYPTDEVFLTADEVFLTVLRAAIEIQRGNRAQALQILQAASRYESASAFWQNYLRGQIYLSERKGAEAAAEFQKILDHRGWYHGSGLYIQSHLGLARAAALQGDPTKARKSYQDFLALWKEADADLPVLIEAKKEYEKVK